MRVVCVSKENRDYSRSVSEWLEDFYRRTGETVELIDPDVDYNFCASYDIVEYPTVLALGPNGEAINVWKGLPLPLFNEISYYVNA